MQKLDNTEDEAQQLPEGWRWLAWNGVRLPVPRGLEPEQLERFYLRAADGRNLALECKWQQGKSVSRKKALKRLRRALKGVQAQIGPEKLPADVKDACRSLEERGFQVQPFSWQGQERQAAGVLLQCGVCGRSSLLQCVGADRPPPETAAVLTGFCDHESDGGLRFELFGISARIPKGFTLKRFSFKPGQYRLELEGGRKQKRAGLVLERIGPASVLLAGATFEQWAKERFATQAGNGELESLTWQGGPAVQWRPRRRGLHVALGRLFGSRKLVHVRAWHPAGSNDVLCVALSGGGKMADKLLEEVCSLYVLAQET